MVACWISLPLILRIEEVGFGMLSCAVPVLREDAHLRHLQRLELNLYGRHLLAKTLVLHQRLGRRP